MKKKTKPKAVKPSTDKRRRTIWIEDDLWAEMKKVARAEDRAVGSWFRITIREKLGLKERE